MEQWTFWIISAGTEDICAALMPIADLRLSTFTSVPEALGAPVTYESRPAVIVLDGCEAISAVEQGVELGHMIGAPLLALVSHYEAAERALLLGADDVVVAPWAPAELRMRVRKLLRRPTPARPAGWRPGDQPGDAARAVLGGEHPAYAPGVRSAGLPGALSRPRGHVRRVAGQRLGAMTMRPARVNWSRVASSACAASWAIAPLNRVTLAPCAVWATAGFRRPHLTGEQAEASPAFALCYQTVTVLSPQAGVFLT